MQDFEKEFEQIKRYINREMSPEETGSFEDKLKSSPELLEVTRDLALLDRSLHIDQSLEQTEITPDDIFDYINNPEGLSEEKISRIEDYFKDNPNARIELDTARESDEAIRKYEIPGESRIQSILEKLLPKSISYRPVFNLIVLIILLIPLSYFGVTIYESLKGPQITTCKLTPSSRTAEKPTIVRLGGDIDSLKFDLKYPVQNIADYRYDIILYDLSNNEIFREENLSFEKAFAITVSTEYFKPGPYILVAERSMDGDSIIQKVSFPFQITIEE